MDATGTKAISEISLTSKFSTFTRKTEQIILQETEMKAIEAQNKYIEELSRIAEQKRAAKL